MAISDIKAFTHLSAEQVEDIGARFDAIRTRVEAERGESDAAYIRGVIKMQRRLATAARITLFASPFPPAWIAGTTMLGIAKILENMEIGHNVMHAQYDWMNDPEIHSSTWEWDSACPSEQWKHSHNYVHHTYTNVLGKDADVGYGILRISRDQKWHPVNLGQPLYNAVLALTFQYGVALHDLDLNGIHNGTVDKKHLLAQLKAIGTKIRKQDGKDYVVFPLLAGPAWLPTLAANATANLMRNLWSYAVIFCGHFPDDVQLFTLDEWENETHAEWYLRQMMGSANISGGRFMHLMTGNLSFQIEHHLFPDLPSSRYPEMAKEVRAIAEEFNLPYVIGPLWKQYGQTLRTITRLAFPAKPKDGFTPVGMRERERGTVGEAEHVTSQLAHQGPITAGV